MLVTKPGIVVSFYQSDVDCSRVKSIQIIFLAGHQREPTYSITEF